MLNERDTKYFAKLGDEDDRKTYKKFMKTGGKKAFNRYKDSQIDDREDYKRRMKYGKHGS
jgi:hypothetical protein